MKAIDDIRLKINFIDPVSRFMDLFVSWISKNNKFNDEFIDFSFSVLTCEFYVKMEVSRRGRQEQYVIEVSDEYVTLELPFGVGLCSLELPRQCEDFLFKKLDEFFYSKLTYKCDFYGFRHRVILKSPEGGEIVITVYKIPSYLKHDIIIDPLLS